MESRSTLLSELESLKKSHDAQTLVIAQSSSDVASAMDEIVNLQDSLSISQENEEALSDAVSSLNSELEQIRGNAGKDDGAAEMTREDNRKLRELAEGLDHENRNLTRRIEVMEEQAEGLRLAKDQKERNIQDHKAIITMQDNKISSLTSDLDSARDKESAAHTEVNRLRSRNDELEARIDVNEALAATLQKGLKTEIDNLRGKIPEMDKTKKENARLEEDLKDLGDRLKEKETENARAESAIKKVSLSRRSTLPQPTNPNFGFK